MPISIRQSMFYLWFLLSWLLILILGESYLGYILMGLISLGMLYFHHQLDWQRVDQFQWLLGLWGSFLLFLILSSFLSANFPLSLHVASRYLFVSALFWFFLLLKRSFFSCQQLLKALLLINLVVLLISMFFIFFPHWGQMLPDMNLLHAIYGHNHLAALLLLFIPTGWWLAGEYVSSGRTIMWWLLPLSLTLGLLSSFGRVVAVIGLVQFLLIWRWLKKDLPSKFYPQKLFRLLISLFLLVLSVKLFFSVVTVIKPDFICPVPSLEKQLCKSVNTELRPLYWQRALEVFRDNIWFGAGPGTFELAIKRYRNSSFEWGTAYAHNAFLQNLAEMGILGGGIFLLLMIYLWLKSWKGFNKKWNYSTALFLGISAIYLDAFFDFDWDFVGILGLTMVLIAVLIREKIPSQPKNKSPDWLVQLTKLVLLIIQITLITLASFYLYTEVLIRSQQISRAFRFFPYFHWQQQVFTKRLDAASPDKERLFEIYGAEPNVYSTWLAETKDENKRQQIKEQWFALDPWAAVKLDLISYYLENSHWSQAEEWIERVYQLWQGALEEITYDEKIKLSEQMLKLADGWYLAGETQRAGQWYLRSRWAEPWILAQHPPVFLKENTLADSQKILFLQEIAQIETSKFLGQYLSDYVDEYYRLALVFSQQDMLVDPAQVVTQILHLADWYQWPLYDGLAKYYLRTGLDSGSLQEFIAIWQVLTELGPDLNWDYQAYPMTNLQLKADEWVDENNYLAAQELVVFMSQLEPQSYWLAVQPANLAVTRGDLEMAQVLYQQCLDRFESSYAIQHDDCFYGLQSVQEGWADSKRYFQVSQIIQGKAVWQDFVVNE